MQEDLIESLSGIRGVFGKSITESLLKKYLFAYFSLFPESKKRFLIAGDTRPSTKSLRESAIKLCPAKEVIDCGIVPIQVAELAVLRSKASGGLYITASHNEPQYNGFKFLKGDGSILYPEQSKALIEKVNSLASFHLDFAKPAIIFRQHEAVLGYVDYVLEKIGEEAVWKIKHSHFKILVDPNGGASIGVLPLVFEEMGVEAEIVNAKPGVFNRLIEPNVISLAPLSEKLENSDFQFACGFDSDADRVEFVLPPSSAFCQKQGSPVLDGNYVLALACDIQLEGTRDQIVVTNNVTSPLVRDVIKKHRASVKEAEIGEMAVVQEMERQKSVVGGEGSNGGVILPPLKCRDGIMTLILILKMLALKGKPLFEILESYPAYYSSRTKISCSKEESLRILSLLSEYFKSQGFLVQETGDLKVWADNNSYIWFHQSGTEAGQFRIIVDGNDKDKVNSLLSLGISAFNKFK